MKENKLLRYMLALSMMLVMGMFVISCGSKDVNPKAPALESGGGGGGDSSSATVSGVAATGKPMIGTVTLKDSTGEVVGPQAIGADGTFSFDVTGLIPPFYIRAEDSGTSEVLYSVSMESGTGNVNPLTNLIVAAAAGVDDPADVYDKLLPISETDLDTAVGDIQDVLAVLLDDYEADNVDPLTDPFTIGQGLDLFFDKVDVDVDNGVVTFKDKDTDGLLCETEIVDLVGSVSYAPVTVDGNGYVTLSGGFKASLSLDVSEEALDIATLIYKDDSEESILLESTSITDISLDGNIATITGNGKIEPIKSTGNLFSNLNTENVSFIATVTDGSSDFSLDAMGIKIFRTSTTYNFTSTPLTGGDGFTITLNPDKT